MSMLLLLHAAFAFLPVCSDVAAPGELVTTSGEALILTHTAFDVEITSGLAEVTLTQRYDNPFDVTVDATYVFPLPPRAAVHDLQLVCGERVLSSEVLRRDEAQQAYDAARSDGRKAALVSQQRPNLFVQQVGGLCPGESVEVVLSYLEPVDERNGGASITLPTTLGPRFDPDDQVVQPPFVPSDRPGRTLDVQVHIHEGVTLTGVWSDTHDLTVFDETVEEVSLTLTEADAIPNQDVHVGWKAAADRPRGAARFDDGHLAVDLFPQTLERLTSPRAREVVFVLDRSSSMGGTPWQDATMAVSGMLSRLRPQDTFTLVQFSDAAEALFRTPQPPSAANLAAASAWMDGGTRGGTHMRAGLDMALSLPGDPEKLRMVLLVTDGFIGDEAEVFRAIDGHTDRARVFTLGVSDAPNAHLLEGAAWHGRGFSFLHRKDTPWRETAADFVRLLEHPAMTDIQLTWEGVEVEDVHPAAVPDLWADRALHLSARGRLTSTSPSGTVRGRVDGRWIEERLPVRVRPADGLDLIWARRHLRELDYAVDREADEVVEDATEVALAHGLVSRWTSRVVVDEQPNPCGGMTVREVAEPALMPPSSFGALHGVPTTAFGVGGLGALGGVVGGGGYGRSLGGAAAVRTGSANDSLDALGGSTAGAFGKPGGSFGSKGGAAMTPSEPIVQGAMTKEVLAAVLRRHTPQVRYCYQRQLRNDPTLEGEIRVRFVIAADGTVAIVSLDGNDVDDAVGTCVVERFKRMRFPATSGGKVLVTYPLTFRPG